MSYNILVINPGSTSTKIGVYQDETLVFDETLRHSAEEIAKYSSIYDQKDFRKEVILSVLKDKNYNIQDLHVIVGRGGMLKSIPGGTYSVTDALMHDLEIGLQGQHASNLGGILAREIGDTLSIPSYIVDPVVVDELEDVARLSGVPSLPRRSVFHALNQKAVAKRYAKEIGVPYESLRLIVVHLGGGFSVGAHANGRVIDVNNALDGEGAFSPERAGTVPAGDLVKLCYSGKYTEKEIYRMLVGGGGYSAYRNTNDARDVERDSLAGDAEATLVLNAMRYQVAKDIGAMATVLKGKVDRIILTGGVAYSPNTCNAIGEATNWIADITVYPGEDELLALAQGALRVLLGQEEVQQYA